MANPTIPIQASACPASCHDCRLRATDAFSAVTAKELSFIEKLRVDTVRFDAGRDIISEQKSTGKIYTLYSGWAFRYKTLSDGRRQIMNFLLPGDLVGLQEKFADGATSGVEAATDAMLCVFPQDGLWELFRNHPNLGYDVTWLAAREENMLDENLLTTGRRNAMERVAMLLLHLFRRAHRVGLTIDGEVSFPFNQQHIADALGMSLVHTNRTLRRLHRLGLHEIRDGRLRLINPRALQRIADYYDRPLRQVPLL